MDPELPVLVPDATDPEPDALESATAAPPSAFSASPAPTVSPPHVTTPKATRAMPEREASLLASTPNHTALTCPALIAHHLEPELADCQGPTC